MQALLTFIPLVRVETSAVLVSLHHSLSVVTFKPKEMAGGRPMLGRC